MGRNRRFLRFFATFACAVFMAFDAFAAGYVCEVTKTYTSCNAGYYFDNGDCISCTTILNNAQVSAPVTVEITGGTRTTTVKCEGTMNAGGGGTNGSSTCSGCSNPVTSYSCSCNTYYAVKAQGTADCSCEQTCSTTQSCSNLEGGWSGTYNECAGDTSTCSKSCTIPCKQEAPDGVAAATYGSETSPGTQYHGSETCNGTATTCTYKATSCESRYYLDNGECKPAPNGYTCDGGTTDINECYKSCKAECTAPTKKPDGVATWTVNEDEFTTGTQKYNGTCDAVAQTCTYTINTCSAGYYLEDGVCKGCPSGYPNSENNNTGGITSCYSEKKTREWTGGQNACSTPSGCATVTCNSCSEKACEYVAYSNSEGTGDGEIKSGCASNSLDCDQTVQFVTASTDHYVDGTTCPACSSSYPYSDGGYITSDSCYTNVTRGCTQNNDTVPYGCESVTAWNECSCTGDTYRKYADGSTFGTTLNETCIKTPKTVRASPTHYVDGTTCPTCLSSSSTYTLSDGGDIDSGFCYRYKVRDCIQEDADVPDGCESVSSWNQCSCTGGKYTEYANGSTSGTTSNETCERTPKTVKASANYYVDGATCPACSSVGDKTYTQSAGGYFGSDYCYKACPDKTGYTYVNGVNYFTASDTCVYDSHTYSIVYNENGGYGTTGPSIHDYDVSKNLTANGFSRTGYTFSKWNTAADGSGTSYENNASVKNLTDKSGELITLYAQWTSNTYNVTYSCGDGSGTAPSQATATYDADFTPATNTCTRSGYTFAGWAVSGTSDIKPENKAFTWKYTENKTFTAQWTVNGANTITYDTVGGEIKDTSYTKSCNAATETFALPTNVVKAGSTFAGWKDASGNNVSTVAKGTCTSALTFTATWTKCDVVEAGACNCESGTYPVDGVCTSCVTSCAGIQGYKLGNYNICSDATAQACYRNCTTSDVANSATVSGTVTKGNQKDCAATKCVSTHYLDSGACKSCPDNATCDGSGDWTCTNGYTKSGTTCKANTYEVTLNANGGTGGTAKVTATFGQKLPAATMPTLVNNAFQGYYDASGVQYYDASGTPVKEWMTAGNGTLTAKWKTTGLVCQAGYYYDGNDHQECKDGWYCPGTGNATIGTAGCYKECPSEYPNSVAGATEEGQCYVECTEKSNCTKVGAPCPGDSCAYNTRAKYYGVMYKSNPGVCVSAPDNPNEMYCPVLEAQCANNQYYTPIDDLENGGCVPCKSLGAGFNLSNQPEATSKVGSVACFTIVDLPCNVPVCPPADLGTCDYDEGHFVTGGGFLYYPGDGSPRPGSAQYYTCPSELNNKNPADWSCFTGYDKNTNANNDPLSGMASAPEDLCLPHVYTVTMHDNGGSGGDGTIYQKYKTGWYADAAAANKLTKITIPQRRYFTFTGYYTTKTALENPQQIFSSTGELTDVGQNADFTTDTTLYAWWSQDLFQCEAGKDASGNACPEGSYCGGWEVNAGTETSTTTGCARTCPSDERGGAISSVAGAKTKTQCYAVLTDVALSDKSGSGDETCYWNENTAAYAQGCTIAVKSCIAGHFREAENSQTCAKVGQKAYSPAGSIEKFLCSALAGANSTVNTATDISGAATDCYNTCSDIDIQNGVRDTTNDKEYYNGTSIPACTYTTVCKDGYQASGEECPPKIFKIELEHDGGTSSVGAIYLKFATGWYSDASASKSITSVPLPTKAGGYTCFGYMSNGNDIVIGADGVLNKNFELFKDNATITAIWEQNDSITCDAGSYYTGTGTTCTTCPVGSYCPGVTTFQDINEVKGLNSCASLGGTYVAAKDIDDKEMTVTVTSVKGAASASECYATNVEYVPSSRLGAGSQTCYFNTATTAYTADCKDEKIIMCNAGHYLVSPTDIDCTPVGIGYYSAEKILTRTACPNLFDGIGVSTVGETSDKITLCYLGDKWEAANAKHEFSDHRLNCYHIDDVNDNNPDTGYSNNCNVPVIVTCAAGYYDDGEYINSNSKRDCVPVGLNAYSPEQAYFADEPAEPLSKTPGSSTKRYECPDGGVTGDATMSDRPSDCYKEKVSCSVNNGSGEYTCNYDDVAGNYSKDCTECVITGCAEGYIQIGDECTDCPADYVCGDNQKRTCAVATGGTHTKSDAGTLDVAYCYRDCVNTGNAAQMSGRDYYGESVADTCKIEACAAGYTLSNNQCVQCPAGYICTPDNPAPQSCATLTNGTHTMSAKGSDDVKDCYAACEEYEVVNGKAIPLESKVFYPKQCEFEGISDTGNPCDIIDGVCVETACKYNFEMIDGVCTPCKRDHAISYKPTGNCVVESCATGYHPNGQYCDESKKSCEAPNAVSAYQEWSDKNGAFGPCIVTKCEDGYHVAANACQTDEQVCELEHGIGVREWDTVAKAWGKCVATKCDPGYTNDPSQTNELWEQCGRCNNMYSANGDLAASTYVDECEIASCMYQGQKYALENNECVFICKTITEDDDETGTQYWDDKNKKCVRQCSPGYTAW